MSMSSFAFIVHGIQGLYTGQCIGNYMFSNMSVTLEVQHHCDFVEYVGKSQLI